MNIGNIGFGSLSIAPRQMYMQRQKASQPAFSMMHQRPDPVYQLKKGDTIPGRNEIIEKDETTGLLIDLETLSPEDLNNKYFSSHEHSGERR